MRHKLYNLGIYLYGALIAVAALFSRKARLWRQGRRDWLSRLDERMRLARTDGRRRVIWIHCASLGEFEQGRSLIDAWRKDLSQPSSDSTGSSIAQDFLLLSFFSPSGYEQRKDYANVDHVCYLPLDTPQNAARFLDIVQPDLAIFIRYEFWYNYLHQLHLRRVPTYLVAAVIGENSPLFKGFLQPLYRDIFAWYRHIFVQDAQSALLLQERLNLSSTAAGDTRIDAIVESRLRVASSLASLPEFSAKQEKNIFIGGSVYWSERHFLLRVAKALASKGWLIRIVPHEVERSGIERWRAFFRHAGIAVAVYSDYAGDAAPAPQKGEEGSAQLWIIDTIGMLKRLYAQAKIAYVGGALAGGNLHNVVEAAVYHVPVFAGKSRRRFIEADDLEKRGLLHLLPAARSESQQIEAAEYLLNSLPPILEQDNTAAFEAFFAQHAGATQKIIDIIRNNE